MIFLFTFRWHSLFLAAVTLASSVGWAADLTEADRNLAGYWRAEVDLLADRCLSDVRSRDDWEHQRAERRRQLFEMLGLWPLPPRSDLQPVITGRIETDAFAVENLHFQSMPGLYVTANLYLPRQRDIDQRLPAILYVCGHAEVKTNGVSLGNKTAYQHHGAWFASHGYVCLTIDTLQLGEIQGDHHGTHRLGQWWWNARGYTPAGVEAWNCIRALDYLESRKEVDAQRIGMTGRSGGGSYTWTTAALDERVRAAAPVAGITDLRNHVIDGCIEGHCDCMYFLNFHRWDFALNAALMAPRPLLIVNTDADSIFPLDGVQRVHRQVRRIYDLYQASNRLGLVIAPGPHKDTQDLQVPVFRWFNQHLKGEDPLIAEPARRFADPRQLRVFAERPDDQINTRIQELFVPARAPKAITSDEEQTLLARLREQTFGGWPALPPALVLRPINQIRQGGARWSVFEFQSQPHVPLHLFVIEPSRRSQRTAIILHVLDAQGWTNWSRTLLPAFRTSIGRPETEAPTLPTHLSTGHQPTDAVEVWFAPRGIGPSAWSGNAQKQVHIRRRFMLLGQTLDGMRVWDIRRAMQAVRSIYPSRSLPGPLTLRAERTMAVNAVYASMFEPGGVQLDVGDLPASHRDGPDYLNVLKFMDIPQALEFSRIRLEHQAKPSPP